MKCYQPDVHFINENEYKNREEFVEVISPSLSRGATFLVTIAGVNCNALIDTSAMRSCISKIFYLSLIFSQKQNNNFCC